MIRCIGTATAVGRVDEGDNDRSVPERVRCCGCDLEIDEAEAQAQRWGYWFVVGELYPYCPACALREFGRPGGAGIR